jgi:hypothetical protein
MSSEAELAARRFETGDVRPEPDDASVDCVVMTRVLINMATDDARQRALAGSAGRPARRYRTGTGATLGGGG